MLPAPQARRESAPIYNYGLCVLEVQCPECGALPGAACWSDVPPPRHAPPVSTGCEGTHYLRYFAYSKAAA